jgi:hypothetical protein
VRLSASLRLVGEGSVGPVTGWLDVWSLPRAPDNGRRVLAAPTTGGTGGFWQCGGRPSPRLCGIPASGSAAAAHRPGSAASLLIQVEIGLGVVNVHHLDERSVRRIAQANNADCQQK